MMTFPFCVPYKYLESMHPTGLHKPSYVFLTCTLQWSSFHGVCINAYNFVTWLPTEIDLAKLHWEGCCMWSEHNINWHFLQCVSLCVLQSFNWNYIHTCSLWVDFRIYLPSICPHLLAPLLNCTGLPTSFWPVHHTLGNTMALVHTNSYNFITWLPNWNRSSYS